MASITIIFTFVTVLCAFSNVQSRCPTDIVYLVDQSTSITKAVYTSQVIPFLKETIDQLKINEQGDHVSVIRFSSPQTTMVDFQFNYDKSQIIEKVMKLDYEGGATATVQALRLAYENVFVYEKARQSGYKSKTVAPVAVIITDGVATDGDAADYAKKLIEKGELIFAIGVGPMVSDDYLTGIAGNAARVFQINDYKNFNQALEKIISENTKC